MTQPIPPDFVAPEIHTAVPAVPPLHAEAVRDLALDPAASAPLPVTPEPHPSLAVTG